MTSLTELNKKWWYRLLKVLYLGFFLIIGIGSALLIYFSFQTREVPDLGVICKYGNRASFHAQHDKGINISSYDAYKAMPSDLNDSIMKACEITPADITQARIDSAMKAAEFRKRGGCDQSSNWGLGNSILCDSTPSRPIETYQAGLDNVTEDNNVQALLYAFADLLGFFILFEIGRRAFYYISLGAIRPKK